MNKPLVFFGLDLRSVLRRFEKLDAMRFERRPSEFEVRMKRRQWAKSLVSGRATAIQNDRWLITLSIGPEAPIENVVETLLHEVVHASCPFREHHGELFCRRLIASANEAFGLALDPAGLLKIEVGSGLQRRAYAIDDVIIDVMKRSNAAGALLLDPSLQPPIPPPPPTPEEIAAQKEERRRERVEERRAHVEAMVNKWEKKLTAAKTHLAKWEKKLRYYESKPALAAKRSEPSS